MTAKPMPKPHLPVGKCLKERESKLVELCRSAPTKLLQFYDLVDPIARQYGLKLSSNRHYAMRLLEKYNPDVCDAYKRQQKETAKQSRAEAVKERHEARRRVQEDLDADNSPSDLDTYGLNVKIDPEDS